MNRRKRNSHFLGFFLKLDSSSKLVFPFIYTIACNFSIGIQSVVTRMQKDLNPFLRFSMEYAFPLDLSTHY